LNLRQFVHGGLGGTLQTRHVGPRTLQERFGTVRLAQHGEHHVTRLDVRMIGAQGQGLSFAQGFLEFGGEFIQTHVNFPHNKWSLIRT